MRLVKIAIPSDPDLAIRRTLEERGIEYVDVDTAQSDRYSQEISFVLPPHAVEQVLDELTAAGLTDRAQTVVIDIETALSEDLEALAASFDREQTAEDQIARQELQTRADDLTPTVPIYVTMTLISAIVATAGLLLNSPAVVVGSMVIAPLIGPALSASVGTVVNDDELFRAGVQHQILGIVAAIAGATVFAAFLRVTLLVPTGPEVLLIPEVAERLRPDLLSLFIALGAGVAGVLSLTAGISAALVGVMIAAALIPPAAAAGVAIAWGDPLAAIGATVLVLVNLVSINIAGLLTLWHVGYRPERFFETSHARRQVLFQLGMYGTAAAILSSFLVASSVTAVRHAAFEADVRAAVEDVLSRDAYQHLTVLEVSVAFEDGPVLTAPELVTVEIGSSHGGQEPAIGREIQAEIAARTDQDVPVRVQLITVTEAEATTLDDADPAEPGDD